MRLGGLSAWTSLAGLGVVLTMASGCQMPMPEEGAENQDPNNFDPSQMGPGSSTNPNPGSSTYMPGGSSLPAPRKLALDLSGVAGFAILDDEDSSSDMPSSGGITGAASGGVGSSMYLESSGAGQLLVRSVDRFALQADPIGSGWRGGSSGVSQEDPGGATSPPPAGDLAAPAPAPNPQPGTQENVGEQAGLLKITQDGEIVPALVAVEEPAAPVTGSAPATGTTTTSDPATSGGSASGSGSASSGTAPAPTSGATQPTRPAEPLPRVTALGLSPDGSVYVLFEHGFFYRQPTSEEAAAPGFDPYSPQSPYRCQLFRADGSWRSTEAGSQDLAQLECVTSAYDVPTWDVRRVMQFDAAGKLYFRAVTPTNPQGVFVQFDPTTKQLSEKVNANICWSDVQVTPRGSLFYTGSSSTNGSCGGGTSFFRYVSADNRLTEIARDWWNFKYLAEQDPEDPNNERIIFYGPDPAANTSGGYSWDSACLYRYNPANPLAERTEKLVECYRDGWSYVNGQSRDQPMPMPSLPSEEELPAFQARCESEGQLFIGGDGVTALSQLQDGTLFVVGKFQRKLAGELACGLDVQVDHCALLGNGGPGDGLDAVHATEQACTDAGHVWMRTGPGCSNGVDQTPEDCDANGGIWTFGANDRHYEMTGSACASVGAGITLNRLDCRAPGQLGQFSQEVNGLGYLVEASQAEPAHLALLSDPAEDVEHYWPVQGANGPELFYSVYSAGQYNLRMATQVAGAGGQVEIQRRSLLDDYEVYNLQRDPSNPSRVLFDALQFSTNSYLFGSIDPSLGTPEEVQASLQVVSGVSGKVETLIILPNF